MQDIRRGYSNNEDFGKEVVGEVKRKIELRDNSSVVSRFGLAAYNFVLLLFFTEATFYYGVAVFLLMLDRLMRPKQLDLSANNSNTLSLQLEQ
ncbi:hypothetical protein JHK85_006570 [Glycine max]|nr:hypothetical protein JHK85_006570 [Glycine max]